MIYPINKHLIQRVYLSVVNDKISQRTICSSEIGIYQFRESTQLISLIVPEVCEAIINALSTSHNMGDSR